MTKQTKSLIKKLILLILAVMTPLTLFFPLIKASDDTATLSYNGFSFLDFAYFKGGGISDFATFAGISTIFQLLFSFISIIIAIRLFASTTQRTKGAGIITFALIVSILYFIEGIILRQTMISKLILNETYIEQYIKTMCYIPLIIQVVLSIFYYIILNYATVIEVDDKNSTATKTTITPIIPPNTTTITKKESDLNKIELLKKYKELLDSGIITQEEFDEKKEKLL